MILLKDQNNLEIGKYYLFYWNLCTDGVFSKYIRIAKILYCAVHYNTDYDVDVAYSQGTKYYAWGNRLGQQQWSLEYSYGDVLLIYELTDDDIYSNVLIGEL